MRKALWAAAAMVLTACSNPAGTPSATPQRTPDFGTAVTASDRAYQRRLIVFDDTGLLAGVHPAPAATFAGEQIWWMPVADDERSIVLGWWGGVCTLDPTLSVTGTMPDVSLSLHDGDPRPLGPNEACPGVGIGYAVSLAFKVPILTLHVSVNLSQRPPGGEAH